MTKTVRRSLVLAVGVGASLAAVAGIANAQTPDKPAQGPTQVQVLPGVGVPVGDPTLGESQLLSPFYGVLGAAG
jgi:hypothetical protein